MDDDQWSKAVKYALTKNWTQLKNSLYMQDIVDYLIENEVITFDYWKKLRSEKTTDPDRMEDFLVSKVAQFNEHKFNHFAEALIRIKREDLLQKLMECLNMKFMENPGFSNKNVAMAHANNYTARNDLGDLSPSEKQPKPAHENTNNGHNVSLESNRVRQSTYKTTNHGMSSEMKGTKQTGTNSVQKGAENLQNKPDIDMNNEKEISNEGEKLKIEAKNSKAINSYDKSNNFEGETKETINVCERPKVNLEDVKQKNDELDKRMAFVESEIQNLKYEVKALRLKLEERESELTHIRMALDLAAKMTDLKNANKELMEIFSNINLFLHGLLSNKSKDKNKTFEKEEESMLSVFQRALNNSEKEKMDLKNEKMKLEKQLINIHMTSNNSEKEKKDFDKEMTEMREKNKKLEKEKESKLNDLKKKLDDTEVERERLANKVTHLETVIVRLNNENNKLRDETESLREQRNILERERNALLSRCVQQR